MTGKDPQPNPLPGGEGKEIERAANEIRLAADDIYRRDPRRFQKLIVWVHTVLKRGYEVEHVLQALRNFNERESKGERYQNWWPYLYAILRRVRTEKLQGEAEQYKKGLPNHVRAIMREILRTALGE